MKTLHTLYNVPLTDLMFTIEDLWDTHNLNVYLYKIQYLDMMCNHFYLKGYTRLSDDLHTQFMTILNVIYGQLIDQYVKDGFIEN